MGLFFLARERGGLNLSLSPDCGITMTYYIQCWERLKMCFAILKKKKSCARQKNCACRLMPDVVPTERMVGSCDATTTTAVLLSPQWEKPDRVTLPCTPETKAQDKTGKVVQWDSSKRSLLLLCSRGGKLERKKKCKFDNHLQSSLWRLFFT